VDKARHEVDSQTPDRLADTVRKVFGRVLKELADIDNPVRMLVGSSEGQGGPLETGPAGSGSPK